jgi:peroxiredoxin
MLRMVPTTIQNSSKPLATRPSSGTGATGCASLAAFSANEHGKILPIAVGLLVAGALAVIGWRLNSTTELAPQALYNTIEGQKLTTESLKGKVVLVNFWATSCVTCVAEMPKLVKAHETYKARGYETVAVAMSYDRPDYVVNFVKQRQLPFKVVLDGDGKLAKDFGLVKITPTSILIGTQGQILKRWVGEPDFEQLDRLVQEQTGKSTS